MDPSLSDGELEGEHFRSLFAAVQSGDRGATERLLQRHLSGLHAYLRLRAGALVRGRESCSDLVQSVCREVIQDVAGVECDTEVAFRHWLYAVAYHKIVRKAEYHGAQRRSPAREVGQLDRGGPDALLASYASFATPSAHAAAGEELRRIEEAMDQLSATDRELIVEARLAGRSHADLAAEHGKTEVAIRKALSRALARLALLLGEPR